MKALSLLFTSMLMINRSVVTNYAHQHNGQYYYSDFNNCLVEYDKTVNGDTDSFNFELYQPMKYENGSYTWHTAEDLEIGTYADGFDGFNNAVLYSWSAYEYSISYETSAAKYEPTLSFEPNYNYIKVTTSSNYDTNTIQELNSDNYLLSFDVASFGYTDIAVNYFVSWQTSTSNYAMNCYNGTIRKNITLDNHFDIPYQVQSSQTPSFVDNYNLRIFVNLVVDGGSGYSEGYQTGYGYGYNDGQEEGYAEGLNAGDAIGYNRGFNEGANSGNSFIRLLLAVTDMPIYYLRSLFSVEIFGVKVYSVVLSLITTMVLVWVIRKFVL